MADTRYMTATRKTTVTHTDGTKSTRGSKTRAYTHAVEITPAPARAYADFLIRQGQALTAKATAYRQAATDGRVAIVSRGITTSDPLINHQATLIGTDRGIYTWCSADGQTRDIMQDGYPVAGVRQSLVAHAVAMAERYEADAAKLADEATEIATAGTPVGAYGVLRWSSSQALAGKGMNEFATYTDRGHTIRVVPVD